MRFFNDDYKVKTIDYQTGSISIVLYLGQNDRVQLELSEGQLYEPSNSLRGYTTFTGYKLS